MVRKSLGLALGVTAMALSGCGADARVDAAKSVERFLKAAHDGDSAGFEAAVDRPALRADLRRQLVAMAQADLLEVEGGPSDFVLDRMIAPDAFHLVQAETGQALPQAPNAAEIAVMMKVLDRQHVCLHDAAKEDRCLLTFAKQDKGAWKLVGMQATDLRIVVRPPPQKKSP